MVKDICIKTVQNVHKKGCRKLTIMYTDRKPENQEGDGATAAKTRGQQRYGPGSGVGA